MAEFSNHNISNESGKFKCIKSVPDPRYQNTLRALRQTLKISEKNPITFTHRYRKIIGCKIHFFQVRNEFV